MNIKVDTSGWKAHSAFIQRKLIEELDGTTISVAGPVADMRKQWAKRYEGFVRTRFNANSRGAGDGSWPPLALSTIVARERKGGKNLKRIKGKMIDGKAVYDSRTGTVSLARNTRHNEGPDLGGFRFGRLQGAIVKSTKSGRGFGKLVGIAVAILKDTGLLFNALLAGQPGNRINQIPGGIEIGFSNFPHATGKGKNPTIANLASWHHFGVPKNHLPARTILVAPNAETQTGMADDARRCINRIERLWQSGGV